MFSYKYLKVLRLLVCEFEIGATLVSSCLRHSAHTAASLHFAPGRVSDGRISSMRRRPGFPSSDNVQMWRTKSTQTWRTKSTQKHPPGKTDQMSSGQSLENNMVAGPCRRPRQHGERTETEQKPHFCRNWTNSVKTCQRGWRQEQNTRLKANCHYSL